jgi:Protein of unknown function (DUF3300)
MKTTRKQKRTAAALMGMLVIAIAVLPAPAPAQEASDVSPVPPPSVPPPRSAADLEKLAAPIALYPDPLLAVVLPAAAYPVEVVQAARFVADTNNLATLDDQPWDANVKAVARFPTVIQKMNDDLGWTAELGQAFVNQPSDLMDAIQSLRAKAQSAGTLQTTPEQVVVVTNAVVERTYETQIVYVTNTVVQIVPANPQVIYVPTYSPTIVYAPPPTYVYSPAAPLIFFSAGIVAGVIIANNHCDWHYGGVYYGRSTTVVVYRGSGYGRYPYYPPPPYYRPPPYYPPPGYRPPPPGYRPPGIPPPGNYPPRPTPYAGNGSSRPANTGAGTASTMQRWQPDQSRLATTGAANTQASINTMEARGWSSGAGNATTRPASGNGASTGAVRPATTSPRPAQNVTTPSTPGPSYNSPTQSPNVTRPASSPSRPAASQPVNRPSQPNAGQGSAFGGVDNGAAARDSSQRGAASRGAGQNSGGNSRGGRR